MNEQPPRTGHSPDGQGGTDRRSDIGAVAVLNDPVRLALYEYVTSQAEAVSRDQAAGAVAIAREKAADHLDRLAEAGLLEVEFRRLSGRRGPGAGRPAKLYRRSAREVHVSFPPRRYDLAARFLAEALRGAEARSPLALLAQSARDFGKTLGAEVRRRAGTRASRRRLFDGIVGELRDRGYEPSPNSHQVILRNCPYEALSKQHPDVICAMNRALMEGVVAGAQASDLATTFGREPGRCCVIINRR